MKKSISLCTVAFLINILLLNAVILADDKKDKDLHRAEMIKAGIIKLGTGEEARVHIKLHNRTKLAGYVEEAGEDTFVVVDAETNGRSTLSYRDIAQVKGHNLSSDAKIAVAIGVLVAILVVAIVFTPR